MGNDEKRKNMYLDCAFAWNPCKGCYLFCPYCEASFQAQSKRHRWTCKVLNEAGESKCYTYEPHIHPERLTEEYTKRKFPKETSGDEFVWAVSSGDISCMKWSWIEKVLEVIKKYPHLTFFMQTKNPKIFEKFNYPEANGIPYNIDIGITLETNKNHGIGKAPIPSRRYKFFRDIDWNRKRVTIEPILDFDLDILVEWIREIDPEIVYIGYDSKIQNKKLKLPEPSLNKTFRLIEALSQFTKVKTKLIREKWYHETPLTKWLEGIS